MKKKRMALAVLAFLVVLFAALLWGWPSDLDTEAGTPTDGAMAIDCDASQGGVQTDCLYAPGFYIQHPSTRHRSSGRRLLRIPSEDALDGWRRQLRADRGRG